VSAAQQAFVDAAEALGATAPAGARALAELPRLSARELDELVERGLVREAADWRYYVFRPRGAPADAPVLAPPPAAPPAAWPPARWAPRGRHWATTLLFWLLVLLIPVLFLQLGVGR
jgi:hypothetical protein